MTVQTWKDYRHPAMLPTYLAHLRRAAVEQSDIGTTPFAGQTIQASKRNRFTWKKHIEYIQPRHASPGNTPPSIVQQLHKGRQSKKAYTEGWQPIVGPTWLLGCGMGVATVRKRY